LTTLRFGPAGKPTNFGGDYEDVLPLLRQMGLDALEYEAVRGVRVAREKAERIREAAQQNDVVLSMHAPYFINLASPEEDTVRRALRGSGRRPRHQSGWAPTPLSSTQAT